MFFLPRQTPLISLAMVIGLIFALALGADGVVHVLSGVLVVFLVLAVLFDRWESPKR